MKTNSILAVLLLLLVSAAHAGDIKLGVGAAGGVTFPVAQDDQGNGTAFELRGIVELIPAVIVEPNLNLVRYGEPDMTSIGIPGGVDGADVTGYGVDALLGGAIGKSGLSAYGMVGAGIYKTKQDQFDVDNSDFGWSAGFGLLVGLTPQFGVDVRGRMLVVNSEGGGSKKAATVTGGLNFYFGN